MRRGWWIVWLAGSGCPEPSGPPAAEVVASLETSDDLCTRIESLGSTVAKSEALIRRFKESGEPEKADELRERTVSFQELYDARVAEARDRGLKCADAAWTPATSPAGQQQGQ